MRDFLIIYLRVVSVILIVRSIYIGRTLKYRRNFKPISEAVYSLVHSLIPIANIDFFITSVVGVFAPTEIIKNTCEALDNLEDEFDKKVRKIKEEEK